METTSVVLITLVAYKVILIGVGLWAARRNKTETDFFLGGRGLGPYVAGFSYAASTSSAWVILGFSGFVYTAGVSALWMIPGIWAGYAIVWLHFGERLRRESLEKNQLTLTDFVLQDAAEDSNQKRWVRLTASIAAVLILVCFVFYIAAQFDAAGKALAEHFSMSTAQAVSLGAAIVLLYSLLGGFWAVSVTDTLQAVIMLLVALGVPIAAVIAAGGPGQIWHTLLETMPASYLSPLGGQAGFLFGGFLIGLIGMSLGALGQPHLLTRLMAVRGEAERKAGFRVAILWGVLVFLGMAVLGLTARVLLPDLANAETVFYESANRFLPTVLSGIVIAATLSAVMSTVDSIMLAAAGAVAHDMGINRRFPNRQLLVSRIVMFLIAVVAVTMTLTLPDSIFNRVLFAWSALGAAFGPLVVWRVAGRKLDAIAALVSMLLGFATTVVFYSLGAAAPSPGLLSQAAHLPGDPFERVVPWVPALIALWALQKPATRRASEVTHEN